MVEYPMKKGLISVVMSAYNSERFIAESISSILNQTYEDWELVLINDASSDNTLEIITRLSREDPRIKVIDNAKNLGLTVSLNVGIKNSRGEFIARLDSDDLAEPSRLETQLEYLHSSPRCRISRIWGLSCEQLWEPDRVYECNVTAILCE